MKTIVLAVVLALGNAACSSGPKQTTTPDPVPGGGSSAGPVQDTRTPLEKRRDAACDVVAKRATACAVEDAKADLAAGKVKKEQFDQDTKAAVVAKNAEKYADDCKAHKDYSSRQVRVLEKCPQYETECAPFLACLDHVKPDKTAPAPAGSPR
jgi:hypothetical protein